MTNEKLIEALKIREAFLTFATEHPIPQLSEEEICKAAKIYLKNFNWLLDHHFSFAFARNILNYSMQSFDVIISDIIEKEFKNGIYSILCFIYNEQDTYLDNYCYAFYEYRNKFYEQLEKVADKVNELSKNIIIRKTSTNYVKPIYINYNKEK